MTRFPHDQFAKHCFEPLLSSIGQFTPSLKVSAEVRESDIYFEPSPTASPPADLGLLYRCVSRATVFEPFSRSKNGLQEFSLLQMAGSPASLWQTDFPKLLKPCGFVSFAPANFKHRLLLN
jgi:hypothetical protein